MRRTIAWSLVALSAIVPLRGADWPTHSGDNQRTAWQQDESALTRENVTGLQLLWKLKLDNQSRSVYSLTAPLVVQRLITDRGFKELVYLAGSSDNLFAVDADLGRLFWSRHFTYDADVAQQPTSSFLCPGGLNATPAIQPGPTFGRGRGTAPAAPAPSPARPAANPSAVRAIYVATSDGNLHQINVNNGDDMTPAARFLPPNAKPYSLALVNNVLYTITGQGCGGNPNSAYAIE